MKNHTPKTFEKNSNNSMWNLRKNNHNCLCHSVVVVNDLGGSAFGDGADNRPAIKVCEEIEALGGEAIPNFDSVVDGDKVIQTALDLSLIHIDAADE